MPEVDATEKRYNLNEIVRIFRMDELPDLFSLACFEAAARTLNFRAAARSVALSSAAFSDRIRRLEEHLEVGLFDRTTRRVQLTPAGQRLLTHARDLLQSARVCRDVAHGKGSVTPYALTIGTRFELGMSWLVPALEPLSLARPERTLHLAFGSGSEILARLRRGELDAVISSSRLVERGLAYVPLHIETYVFVASPRLLEDKPLAHPDDAAAHHLLDSEPSLPLFRYHLDARTDGRVLDFAGHSYLGTIGAIRQRARRGGGVGVLPRYFVQRDLEDGSLQVVFPEVEPLADTFRLVWLEGHRSSTELVNLGEELRQLPLT